MELSHILFFIELFILLKENTFLTQHKCNLSILSILPYTTNMSIVVDHSDGPDIIPAVYLALEMINNRSDILEDYHLELIDGHAGCGDAVLTLSENVLIKEMFYSGKSIVGIVGPRCYDSAERVGLITAKDGIALVNVHTSSASILGNATLYPYSVGTTPSILRFVDALVALMKHSGWKHIGLLFQDSTSSYSVFLGLVFKGRQMNDYEIAFSSLVTENYIPLDGIHTSSAHIVVVSVNAVLAKKLMCIVFHKDMSFPKYQWIFLYRKLMDFSETKFQYGNTWYKCSRQEMAIAVNNSISIDFRYDPENHSEPLFSGLTYIEYTKKYISAVNRYNSGEYGEPVRMATTSPLGNAFHDAVWVLALALNASDAWMKRENKSLCEYGYGQAATTHRIWAEVCKIRFLGASGWNSYINCSKFTPGVVIMSQFVSNEALTVAIYNDNEELVTSQNIILLSNPGEKYQVSLILLAIFLLFVLIAFLLIVIINILNVLLREHSSVKASSHRLNHLAYIGCYFLLIGIIILNITESFFFSLKVKTYLCNSLPFLVSSGFTLVYGTLIVKSCRLYKLLVVSARSLQRPPAGNKAMDDSILMAIIVACTLPNVIICAIWIFVDPIIVTSYTYLDTRTAKPSYIVFESCIINGTHFPVMWLGILLSYEGLLCIIAGFISFLTRSISIQNFKTGNILLLSALLFVSCGVGLPTIVILLSLNISSDTLHISLFSVMFVLLTVFVYLCVFLLFLPPVFTGIKDRISIRHKK